MKDPYVQSLVVMAKGLRYTGYALAAIGAASIIHLVATIDTSKQSDNILRWNNALTVLVFAGGSLILSGVSGMVASQYQGEE